MQNKISSSYSASMSWMVFQTNTIYVTQATWPIHT